MDRLRLLVAKLEQEMGRVQARTMLCRSLGKSERTLLSWLQKGVPTANDAVALALACKCNEQEAWGIARACFPIVAKESA